MTVMFYSQQLYHVAETIKLQFDTPANYFIKMEETLMIKFGKWIAIVLSMVVILTACQNKSEESNEESKSEGGKSDKLVLYAAGPDDLVNDMVKNSKKSQVKSSSLSRYYW